MLLIFFEVWFIIISSLPLSSNIMDILQESLFSSSTSNSKRKTKKSRQNHSTDNQFLQENDTLSEPLLSPSENDNSIELGTIDSDDDNDTKITTRHIKRSRHINEQSTPTAYGGGSIVIVEKPIQPNETIQAFAIRYRVPVCFLIFFV
jgi:hypothetical protein